MKRKILFRGKLVESEEWAYGTYHYSDDDKNHYIINNEQRFLVKPETVGQYTGKDDINGVKIFEDDIVSFKRPIGNWSGKFLTTNHVIAWDELVSRFSLGTEPESIKFRHIHNYEYLVIGNIYDNSLI